MITSDDIPRLIDFGLSYSLAADEDAPKSEVTVNDSLRWMAPEIYNSNDRIRTTASDIWALGMVYLVSDVFESGFINSIPYNIPNRRC